MYEMKLEKSVSRATYLCDDRTVLRIAHVIEMSAMRHNRYMCNCAVVCLQYNHMLCNHCSCIMTKPHKYYVPMKGEK